MSNDEFMTLLQPHLNQPPEDFIKNLSELPDASRKIVFQDGDFGSSYVNSEDENGIEIINPDEGFKVTVEKITKKYTFVDPVSDFAIEMNDLMAFLKKYYDDEGCQSPREDTRIHEHIDWPLPAPAPEPPPAVPGGTWIWHDGTPGYPPEDPTYVHRGGNDVDINPPTGGTSGYEPTIPGDLDGGSKDWEIPGIPATEGKDGGEDSENKEDENDNSSIQLCDCGGSDCSICNPSSSKEKIKLNKNTKWDAVPGKPGKDPTQGHYEWQPDPPPPEPGSEGSDGNPGGGSGGSNGSDGQSGGGSGGGGSSGGGTPGGGGSGGGGGGGTPAPAPRYSSGCC